MEITITNSHGTYSVSLEDFAAKFDDFLTMFPESAEVGYVLRAFLQDYKDV